MGSVAAATSPPKPFLLPNNISNHHSDAQTAPPPSNSKGVPDNSMSQGFHQGGAGVYGFSNDDHRSSRDKQAQVRNSYVVDPSDTSLIGAQDDNDSSIYDVPSGSNASGGGMLMSDMFAAAAAAGFAGNQGVVGGAAELLASQISAANNAYRFQRQPTGFSSLPGGGDWYGASGSNRQQQQVTGSLVVPSGVHGGGDAKAVIGAGARQLTHGLQSVPSNGADAEESSAAAAMRLFLSTNQQTSTSHQNQLAAQHHHQQQQLQQQQHHQRSQSPPSPSSAAALPQTHALQHQTSFHSPSFGSNSYGSGNGGGGVPPQQLESGKGLSLSLSTSLQQFELARPDEFHNRDRMLYFSAAGTASAGGGSLHNSHQQQALHLLQQQQQGVLQVAPASVAGNLGGTAGMNVLRHSKYARAAQELLEEFCSVGKGAGGGRGNKRVGGGGVSSSNPNPSSSHAGGGGASSSNSPKSEPPPTLSPADRFEQQRRKAKLLAMLDEVDRRYQHYCEQMQMVVNSYDSIMGFGASTPYTALAQRAMSRHFRCLKDAIVGQLKKACELLGDKDGALGGVGGGITKGETPRLKVLDQSLRQQRAFHQMGMMEHEAWRPQRGLPERSVNVLRGWLFEHFLHPYPSDADKHLLARQTGLSRNQVSNWFINARVRLWKPMVEEMYMMESKQEEDKVLGTNEKSTTSANNNQMNNTSQSSPTILPPMQFRQQHQLHHHFGTNIVDSLASPQLISSASYHSDPTSLGMLELTGTSADQLCGLEMQEMVDSSAAHVRFGATGDVSLTLGLRHAGNPHDGGSHFSVRDFGEC